jgi:bifunctional UDP-N-acetylglucosamine pyrophosphorylase/glucosamine-1-phosphate N-acetyltransferase
VSELKTLILAAGKGTRMKSELPKVILPICGVPMIQYVIWEALKLSELKPLVVVGYKGDEVIDLIGDQVEYAWQKEQLGTGHAVKIACDEMGSFSGDLLVLYGDTPFISADSLQGLIKEHQAQKAAATVLTAEVKDPTGYGRIIRSSDGSLKGIVEEQDARAAEKSINEVNTGIYCFSYQELKKIITKIQPQNAQGEYYLTDVIALLAKQGKNLKAVRCSNPGEILGPNNRKALAETERVMQAMILERLMDVGVSIIDPMVTYIDPRVKIGRDTTIYPGTILKGNTKIGENCHIGPFSQVSDSIIGDDCQIQFSTITQTRLKNHVNVGPYAHIRPGTTAEEHTKIGGFVEVKNSQIGEGSKVPHLSYIGDTKIGTDVNIGAGTITCNYDGGNKWETTIKDGAFIGSNTNLVAPVNIGEKAVIGAGSTITEDVPAYALAIARAQQVHKISRPTFEISATKKEQFQMVKLNCLIKGAVICYTLDGTEPTEESLVYSQPLELKEETILKMRAFKEGWYPSKTVSVKITAR